MKRYVAVLLLVFLLPVGGSYGATLSQSRLNEKGISRFKEGKIDQSVDFFGQALSDGDVQAEIYHNLGNAYYQGREWDRAIQAYKEAVQTGNEALKTNIYYNLGNAHFQKREYQQAISAYKQALKRDPSNMDTKHNLEMALRNLHDPDSSSQKKPDHSRNQSGEDQGKPDSGNGAQSPPQEAGNEPRPPSEQKPLSASENAQIRKQNAEMFLNRIDELEKEYRRYYWNRETGPSRPVEKDW